MSDLHIDIETYSSLILPEVGVYAYSASPDFRVLLFAFAYNDEPVTCIDLACGEQIPAAVLRDLKDPNITKMAFNAQFERVCLSAHTRQLLDPDGWYCVAAHAALHGLPTKLDEVSRVLLPEGQQKFGTGKRLIKYFCGPCEPTATNGYRTRNLPRHAPQDWQIFKEYCCQDVVAERAVETRLQTYPFPKQELQLYALDQRINDRGVLLDPQLVYQAIKCDNQHKARLEREALRIAGIDNAKSAKQVKAWLNALAGERDEVVSLAKEAMPELLKNAPTETARRVLEIRRELTKTSVIKYQAMARAIGPDNRVRGLLQYYGANRTGRWSGRLVQVQNLPQNHLPDLALCRDIVKRGDFDGLELLFGSPSQALSELIRTAFIPKPGHRFVVADFSAIEARVIAWFAKEQWRLDVFNTHGKIYEASASAMFKVPIEQITKGSPLRQRGKVAELALGFGGGVKALQAMDTKKEIPEKDLPGLVARWRKASPKIVELWSAVEAAAFDAIEAGPKAKAPQRVGALTFQLYPTGDLRVGLPSGRMLVYQHARVEEDPRWGRDSIYYDGLMSETKAWGKVNTYGGKLTENIVQATARDCLAEALLRLDAAGYKTVMHVHDEAVVEVPNTDTDALRRICDMMGEELTWAPGLPLCAAGFECEFYQKD